MNVIYPLPSKEQLKAIKAYEKHQKEMLRKANERIEKILKEGQTMAASTDGNTSKVLNTVDEIADALTDCIAKSDKRGKKIAVICIGTDRSTGDSLGPLVGMWLEEYDLNCTVCGTLKSPTHAKNLAERMLDFDESEYLIIAIDACLTNNPSRIGGVTVELGSLSPGAGVDKNLPSVGDISIQGVVNIGGFMPMLVLSNTRLNTVYDLSQRISAALIKVISYEEQAETKEE